MDNHFVWRIIDSTITIAIVVSVTYFGNIFLAVAVVFFGLWNFCDGVVRSKW